MNEDGTLALTSENRENDERDECLSKEIHC